MDLIDLTAEDFAGWAARQTEEEVNEANLIEAEGVPEPPDVSQAASDVASLLSIEPNFRTAFTNIVATMTPEMQAVLTSRVRGISLDDAQEIAIKWLADGLITDAGSIAAWIYYLGKQS